jgi:predicted O-methyltransferase YrrM
MDPSALVSKLLADPPLVHPTQGEHTPDSDLSVFHTDRACYELIAETVNQGDTTLETGLGVSTALFASLGAKHHCVVGFSSEVERLRAYFKDRAIDDAQVHFHVGWSDEMLPTLADDGPLDALLIDGGHGFPTPILDWYYAGSRLRAGGLLILDDVQLPAVSMLDDVLRRDDRWSEVRRTWKWVAYRRDSEGSLREEFFRQPHMQEARTLRAQLRRVRRRLRRSSAE